MIPEFAIVGHPNEGKSSVVSTLTEDDSVRISPVPGETLRCDSYSIRAGNEEVIRFIDTPGFQHPLQVLAWITEHGGGPDALAAFVKAHADEPRFQHDRALLEPVVRGAGIIYVLDASRPLRRVDRAEMEILRCSARPRMAILNPKEEDTAFMDEWKVALRQHFNSVRTFNAHRATFAERLALLESLKAMDQDWEKALDRAVASIRQDWDRRTREVARILVNMLWNCLSHRVLRPLDASQDPKDLEADLLRDYQDFIARRERQAHEAMRALFRHNIFHYPLPRESPARTDLFSSETWRLLGLTRSQLAVVALSIGAAGGIILDVAAAGITFGVFTVLGAAGGAAGVLAGSDRLVNTRIMGQKLGGQSLVVGPCKNVQFLFILLDRSLLVYNHVINWAHGRRDAAAPPPVPADRGKAGFIHASVCPSPIEGVHCAADRGKVGFTHAWTREERDGICGKFFKAAIQEGMAEEARDGRLAWLDRFMPGPDPANTDSEAARAREAMNDLLRGKLAALSQGTASGRG